MKIQLALVGIIAWTSQVVGAEPVLRERVDPVRVVWASKGTVSGADALLLPKTGQVPERGWNKERMAEGCCLMTNGGTAAVLIDFGRELHGGLRLAVSAKSAKGMKFRTLRRIRLGGDERTWRTRSMQ